MGMKIILAKYDNNLTTSVYSSNSFITDIDIINNKLTIDDITAVMDASGKFYNLDTLLSFEYQPVCFLHNTLVQVAKDISGGKVIQQPRVVKLSGGITVNAAKNVITITSITDTTIIIYQSRTESNWFKYIS